MLIILLINICILLYIIVKILIFNNKAIVLQPFDNNKSLYLKAVMSLSIVLCHLSVFAGPLMPSGGRLVATGLPIVAVFFFLSGYGLSVSLKRKGKSYMKDFFSKRMKRLLVPFVLANIINAIVFCLLGKEFPSLHELVNQFIYMSPFLMFSWFVYALFFLYILFYLSYRFIDNKYISFSILFLSVITFIVYAYVESVFGFWRSTVVSFPLGILFAECDNHIKAFLLRRRLFVLVFYSVFLFLIIGIYLTMKMLHLPEYPDTCIGFIVINFIPITLVLCSYFFCVEGMVGTILGFIGGISYEIYLLHGVVLLDYWFGDLNICVQIVYLYSAVILSAYVMNKIDKFLV